MKSEGHLGGELLAEESRSDRCGGEGRVWHLAMGRFRIPLEVLRDTTRIRPSCPGKVTRTLAKGHWLVNTWSPLMITTSPMRMLGEGLRHLCSCCRYSDDHRRQKFCVIAWHSVQRLNREGSAWMDVSRYAHNSLLMRKCPGVMAVIEWLEIERSGLLFKHDSTCTVMVENSSKSNRIICFKCLLADFPATPEMWVSF